MKKYSKKITMRITVITVLAIGAIGSLSGISFAQNIGDACGDQWKILPLCGAGLKCVYEEGKPAAADWPGTCQTSSPQTPKQGPNLPIWFGPEDRAEKTTGWLSFLTSWRTKPDNPTTKPTQQCKKRDWLGNCLEPVIMYVTKQQSKTPAYLLPPTTGLKPCAKEKELDDNKKGLDCAAPKEEIWKTDANGNRYTVCEEESAPKTSAICYWDWKNEPQGPPKDWRCNDTPS